MSVQPIETESADNFSVPNLFLGLVIGLGMILGWNALMSALQVPYVSRSQEASLPIRLVSLLHTALDFGFIYGAGSISRLNRPMSILGLVGTAIVRALIGGLLIYSSNVASVLLEVAFGRPFGDTVFWILLGILGAFLAASVGLAAHQTNTNSLSFKDYRHALPRLGKRVTLRLIGWSLYGGLVGLLVGLTSNQLIGVAVFVPMSLAVVVWGLWLGKPAIVFDPVRRRNAIRTIISVVAVVGPILLMTFNMQLGLMVLVGVILLYAVITLRK